VLSVILSTVLPFEVEEAAYYTCVWVIAAMAGISRASGDHRINGICSFFNIGTLSGFTGFAVVSLAIGGTDGHIGREFVYLGISALVGLAGKEQERLIRFMLKRILGGTDKDFPPDDPDEPPQSSPH
jgi:hypothetical protein